MKKRQHKKEITRLMLKGTEVFGSQDNFQKWFTTPNNALGGIVPSELANLKNGIQQIFNELGRIEHGVFA